MLDLTAYLTAKIEAEIKLQGEYMPYIPETEGDA